MSRPDISIPGELVLEKMDKGGAEVPKIFKLAQVHASTSDVILQLTNDFYSNEQPPEKVYLALRELRARGNEGLSALQYLARSTDSLGQVATEVLETSSLTDEEIEKILKIKRFGTVFDPSKSNNDIVPLLYQHALKKGYVEKNTSVDDFVESVYEPSIRSGDDFYLNSESRDGLLSARPTVGMAEPAYLELLGPEGILKMRTTGNSNALLLGSYGKDSAIEFSQMTRKINPNFNPHIIDIGTDKIQILKVAQADIGGHITQADALNLPFQDGSIQLVCSNHLFFHLGKENHDLAKKNINQMFQSVGRVLTKGGMFLAVEEGYGDMVDSFDQDRLERELKNFGLKNGFKIFKILDTRLVFLFNKERNSSAISSNGIPYYGDSFIQKAAAQAGTAVAYIKI